MSDSKMIESREPPAKKRKSISWNSREGRGVIYQILAFVIIAIFLFILIDNYQYNMRVRGIKSGYDFMSQPFGFDIGETLISYDRLSTYWKAFAIGLLNTLKVAMIGIVLATILGVLVGVGRFSQNFLVKKICYVYVEIFRNIPVLLQLLVWYLVFTNILPSIENAWQVGNFYLSKKGLSLPWPVWQLGQTLALVGVVAGLALSVWYAKKARAHFDSTGQQRPVIWVSIGLIVGASIVGWVLGGAPMEWNVPSVGRLQIEGGGGSYTRVLGFAHWPGTLYRFVYL